MKRGAKIGAVLGIILWLTFGIVAGIHFGGFGAVSILATLLGGPVPAGLLTKVFVLAGMVVGIFCAWSVSVVLGSLGGALVGAVLETKEGEKVLA